MPAVRLWLAGVAAALVLSAAPAQAQVPDPYARQLAQALARAEQVHAGHGYARAAGPFAGGLGQGLSRSYPISLRAGQALLIVGLCDVRCGDLDLRLRDPGGVIVARDTLQDAAPGIEIQPPATGVYTVEVSMARCAATGPCYFAFNVYSR